MEKDINNLGVNFGEMMDSDFLLDTETGKIITDKNIPGENDNTDTGEEGKEGETPKEDLIEVNIDSDTPPDDDTATAGPSSSSETNQSVLKNLATALYEEGVISELDEEKLNEASESEAEVLIDLIRQEIGRNVENYKEGLPDKVKKIIDNYEEGVPLDVIIGLESANQRLDMITEDQLKDSEDLQKLIVTESLKRAGYSDAKIQKRIQQFEDLGQLEEEAIDSLTEAKEYYATALEAEKNRVKKEQKEAEERQKKTLQDLKKDIMATTEVVPGIKITNKEKEKIYESMTKVVDQDQYGNPMNEVMVTRAKNPMGFEKLLHYYYQLGLFNIDDEGNIAPDLSKLKTSAKSSAIDELNKTLSKKKSSFSSGSPARQHSDPNKLKENIEAMKGLFKH